MSRPERIEIVTQATTGLVWGVKTSFRQYVSRLPDGGVHVRREAGVTAAGDFYFPLAEDPALEHGRVQGVVRFGGGVVFTAHLGLLFVEISDPWMEWNAGEGVLTAETTFDGRRARVPIVTFVPDAPIRREGIDLWPPMPTALTSAGVDLFDDVYPLGAPLDPLHLRLTGQDSPSAPGGIRLPHTADGRREASRVNPSIGKDPAMSTTSDSGHEGDREVVASNARGER